MTEPEKVRMDPLGYREELRHALSRPALAALQAPDADPETVSKDSSHAAFALACALGQCRLYGIEPGVDLDGSLSPAMGLAAALVLTDKVSSWTELVRQLGDSWDNTVDPVAADEPCFDLLERRMMAWAAFVAVDESYMTCLEDQHFLAPRFTEAIDAMLARLEGFDAVLFDQLELLSQVTTTRLLDNWRNLLAERYREILPWWLDGTLEDQAKEIKGKSLALQPPESVWERLRKPSRRQLRPALVHRGTVLAAEKEGQTVLIQAYLRWRSPDGSIAAVLAIPMEVKENEVLVLAFLNTGDQAGEPDLVGQTALLFSVATIINEQRCAHFTFKDLEPHLDEEPVLKVGPQQAAWILLDA